MKRYVYKHFLNTDNVPDARMFTGKLFHSRGDAAPNAESPIHFSLCLSAMLAHSSGVGVRHA